MGYSDLDARLTEVGLERGSSAYYIVARLLKRWDAIEACAKEHGSESGFCPPDCIDADTESCSLCPQVQRDYV